MKKNLFLLMFLAISLFAVANEILEFNVQSDITDFNFQRDNFTTITSNSNDYTFIQEAGNPALPTKTLKYVVDNNANFINLNYSYEKELIRTNVVIEPTQKLVPTEISFPKPDKVLPNKEIYNSKSAFPKEIAVYTSTQKLSNYTFFTVSYSPFIYYPASKELYLIKDLKIKIEYDNSGKNSNKKWDNGIFYSMLKDQVENKFELNRNFRKSRDEDIQYLIITTNDLKESFQVFADWKRSLGTIAKVLTVEDIYNNYSGSSNQIKIKKAIEDYYENYGTVYVLLGGDNTKVPDQDAFGDVNDGQITDNFIPTDLFYACFDNDFAWDADGDNLAGETTDNIDMAPEVLISRAPVRSSSDVEAFMTKTQIYLDNPETENFAKEMCISGLELWNTWSGQSDAHWRGEKMWEDLIQPNWDGTKTRYYDTGTDYAGGAAYNITATHTKEVLNSGFNYFFMGTHGNQQIWSMETGSSFDSYDALSLNNNNSQGLIVTMACITNAFDGSSGFTSDPCLSEGFNRNANGGAVAYHGCSRYGWGYSNQSANPGPSLQYSGTLFNKIFTNDSENDGHTFGTLATETKIEYLGESASYGAFRWIQFGVNAIGDPQVDFYTEDPQEIVANYPSTITLGNSETISIETGIPYAKVCISNEDLYISGTADVSGNFTCNPSPSSLNDLNISITAHNYISFQNTISVIPGNTAFVVIENFEIETNDDNIIEFGENVDVNITFKNVGTVDAENVDFSTTISNIFIDLNTDNVEIGAISSGESVTISGALNFSVSESVSNNYAFTILSSITSGEENWESELDFVAYRPVIELNNITINDQDGNGVLDPGDIATLIINLENNGGADIQNIASELATINENITIEEQTTTITQLNPGENENLEFNITVSEDIQNGDVCNFELNYTADNNISDEFNFVMQIGLIIEDFESGDFSLLEWDLSGTGDWEISDIDPQEGNYCVKTETMIDNQTATLSLDVNIMAPGEITFFRKVSSEADYDYLKFIVDGTLVAQWSGIEDWAEESFEITAGNHELEWSYVKDLYVSENEDCAWLDKITFPAMAPSNTMPEITSYLPNVASIDAVVGDSLNFAIVANDDDEISFEWSVDSDRAVSETSTFNHIFNEEGTFIVKVIVTDGVYSINHSWEIIVEAVTNDDIEIYSYDLSQNYPNPFRNNSDERNSGTTISYSMKNNGHVSVKMYNIKGQLVKTLVNEQKDKGKYIINWNGTDENNKKAASGIYFYKMQTEEYTKFKKALLIK